MRAHAYRLYVLLMRQALLVSFDDKVKQRDWIGNAPFVMEHFSSTHLKRKHKNFSAITEVAFLA